MHTETRTYASDTLAYRSVPLYLSCAAAERPDPRRRQGRRTYRYSRSLVTTYQTPSSLRIDVQARSAKRATVDLESIVAGTNAISKELAYQAIVALDEEYKKKKK